MLAKGTLACQRESDPGHQDRAKGRQRDKENKTPVYPGSTVMLSNTFLVKAVEARANDTYSMGTWFLCLEAKISLPRWFSSVLQMLADMFCQKLFRCREGWEVGPKSAWTHQRMLWRTWLQRPSLHSDTFQHRRRQGVLKDWIKDKQKPNNKKY